MTSLILLTVCLLAGPLLKNLKNFPDQAHLPINTWIIYIAVPAITLHYTPTINFNWTTILPITMAGLVFIISRSIFWLMGRYFNWDKPTIAVLSIVAGLGNTSFLGFPLIEAYFGKEFIQYGVLCDQGSFITLSTVGIGLAMIISSGSANWGQLSKKMFQFPPFIAFLASLILSQLGVPSELDLVFERLGATLIPLALFSVGLQLKFSKDFFSKELFMGLAYKLIIAPAIVFSIYRLVVHEANVLKIMTFESAMAPMITAGIIASQYNLNPKLANGLVSVGIPVSFITTAGWYYFLTFVQ